MTGSTAAARFPPHVRGWTPDNDAGRRRINVSPARAGMDPPNQPTRTKPLSFPRTCGDGPGRQRSERDAPRFPPHVRGWTCLAPWGFWHVTVSPARAGMDRRPRARWRRSTCFPRTCGDGPGIDLSSEASRMFPPHVRGWTGDPLGLTLARFVSPARAGMDPRCRSASRGSPSFPRTCGDGPDPPGEGAAIHTFPPHVRGWTALRLAAVVGERVSPARAGMDLCAGTWTLGLSRFPRTCGDGPSMGGKPGTCIWFPPHVRGWTFLRVIRSSIIGVSPARAGMDRFWRSSRRAR